MKNDITDILTDFSEERIVSYRVNSHSLDFHITNKPRNYQRTLKTIICWFSVLYNDDLQNGNSNTEESMLSD